MEKRKVYGQGCQPVLVNHCVQPSKEVGKSSQDCKALELNRRQWKKHQRQKQKIYDSVDLSETVAGRLNELAESMKGLGLSMDEAIKNVINSIKGKR